MNGAAHPHAILLAAGAAQRYGSPKQLLPIDGVPMVRRAAESILQTGAGLTVVTGANADEIGSALADLPLALLHNEHWAEGMGTSIACGFRAITQQAAPPFAALLCLADQPRVGADALRRLIHAHQQAPQSIVASRYDDVSGPPCLFPAAFYPQLSALRGDRGARSLLKRHAESIVQVDLPEARQDIDTPEDYQALIASQRP